MEKHLNKGNISTVHLVGWGISIAVAAMGFTMAQVSKVSDAQNAALQRISVVETENKQYEQNIEEINKKLDILINNQTKVYGQRASN